MVVGQCGIVGQRRVQEPATVFPERGLGLLVAVGGEVVEHDDSARLQLRGEYVADVSSEGQPVYYRQVNACIHREASHP